MTPESDLDNTRRTGPGRKALLVLGMHRSGTSALAGVLVRLGIEAPRTLMPPNDANPAGFWESEPIVAFHDRTLRERGTSWDAWTRVADEQTAGDAELSRLIEAEFAGASQFAVKDPRMCRLVPLWQRVLAAAQISPAIVLVTRGAADVCRSLAMRDGIPEVFSSLMWLRHVLDAEHTTRGLPRTIVAYDDLLTDWRKVTARIAVDLGVTWPVPDDEAGADIDGFLRTELRHHYQTAELPAVGEPIGRWLVEVEAAIRSLPQADDASDPLTVLDRAAGEIEAIASSVGRGEELLRHRLAMRVDDLATRIGALESETARLRAEREHLHAEIAALQTDRDAWRDRAESLDGQCRTLTAAVRDSERRLVAADAERSRLEHESRASATRADELREAVDRTQADVEGLRRSWSWRITAPLRRTADFLGVKGRPPVS